MMKFLTEAISGGGPTTNTSTNDVLTSRRLLSPRHDNSSRNDTILPTVAGSMCNNANIYETSGGVTVRHITSSDGTKTVDVGYSGVNTHCNDNIMSSIVNVNVMMAENMETVTGHCDLRDPRGEVSSNPLIGSSEFIRKSSSGTPSSFTHSEIVNNNRNNNNNNDNTNNDNTTTNNNNNINSSNNNNRTYHGVKTDIVTHTISDASLTMEMFRLGLPASIGTLLSFGTQTITLSFIGRRLGSDLFAKFSVGLSMFNLVGFSIGYGMIAALDTLVSQSFGRHGQLSNEIGDYLQRALLVVIGFMFPFCLFTYFSESVMVIVFGMEVGVVVSQFLRNAIPYLFFACVTSTFTKVLQAINEPLLPTLAMGVGCIACYFLNLFFTTSSIYEALFCLTATYSIVSCILIIICLVHPRVTFCRRTKWLSPRILEKEGFREFFAIGLPSLFSCVAEWWAFEVLQIIAASVSIQRVAELNLMLAVNSVMFSLAIGVSVASSVKVGNALGENRHILAKRYATTSFRLCQIVAGFNIFVVIFFRKYICIIFTNEEELQKGFETFVFALAIFHFGDSNQYLMQGIFRGAGKQAETVVPVLTSLWLIGLPICYILNTTYNHGVFGIFGGLVIGFMFEMFFLVTRFMNWDWKRLAESASKSTHSSMEAS